MFNAQGIESVHVHCYCKSALTLCEWTDMMQAQAREGREGQQKITALERSLQQVLSDLDAERQMLMQESQQQLADTQADSNSLNRLIK